MAGSRTPPPLRDHTSALSDDCLAFIFGRLRSSDQKHCSLVCRRWRDAEAKSRHGFRLTISAGLPIAAPSLFSRYSAVSALSLHCNSAFATRTCDRTLSIVSLPQLARLRLSRFRLTRAGTAAIARNCPRLTSFSCASSAIGAGAIAALADGCRVLNYLSINASSSIGVIDAVEPSVSTSLRSITLSDTPTELFTPIIACSPHLATLHVRKIFRYQSLVVEREGLFFATSRRKPLEVLDSDVNPDSLFANISPAQLPGIVEIHVEGPKLSDETLFAISRYVTLEVLHVNLNGACTDAGLVAVANNCRLLREIHIDGRWPKNKVGDEGLMAVLRCCLNLRELALVKMNVTSRSLGLIASEGCRLKHLELLDIPAFGDVEICSIAAECNYLKTLSIEGCSVSDHGIKALAEGCPNLVKVVVEICSLITPEGVDWLRSKRASVIVERYDARILQNELVET